MRASLRVDFSRDEVTGAWVTRMYEDGFTTSRSGHHCRECALRYVAEYLKLMADEKVEAVA